MLKIILTALDEHMARAWEKHCDRFVNTSVFRGSILDAPCDAIVSPANSFGFMDGGLDMLYSQHFGWHVQERLQTYIRDRHYGELLIGNAEVVETDHNAIPFLIAAPTMRVPMMLGETVNPYLATRAVLLLIKHGFFHTGSLQGQKMSESIRTVAFPGMGTGVGQIGPHTCANQVRQAIEDVLFEKREFPKTWAHASEMHQLLYTDRVRNLQRAP
jgi:O-acetyl-ADP-ribose deacetylase (regulator of RNase III)